MQASNRRQSVLDAKDLSILAILQHDARASLAAIGRRVGLAPPSVNDRLRRLERDGVIRGYAVRLDPERLGCDITAFVEVFIDHPQREAAFIAAVETMDAILECHHVTGEASILLKVVTGDRASLKAILLDRINALEGVRGTRTTLVLATDKESVALPLPQGGDERAARRRRRGAR